jgi:hypothetical protein
LTVVLYLLRDLLWRNRIMYILMTPLLLLFWLAIGQALMDARWGMTLSLFIAAAIGPMTSIATVGLREIRILPIKFRDLWTLTWAASTVVPSLFLLITASMGIGIVRALNGPTAEFDTAVLIALYGYLLTNAMLVLLPAMNYTSRNMQPGATATALSVSILFVFLASMGLPYVLVPHLPITFEQMSGTSIGLVAAGAAASFGVLAWRPSAGITTRVAHHPKATQRAHPRAMDGVTGIARILVPYLTVTAAVTAAVVAGYTWYAWSYGGGSLAEFMHEEASGMGYVMIGMASPWAPWARLLKHLPMRTRAINVLLLATPLATWTVIAGTLLVLEPWAGPAIPAWFSPWVLVWFSAGSALINAVAFRHQGSIGWIVGPAAITAPFVRGIGRSWLGAGSPWLLVLAALVFGAAAWTNHRTLTRCGSASRAFRRPTAGMFSANGPIEPRL